MSYLDDDLLPPADCDESVAPEEDGDSRAREDADMMHRQPLNGNVNAGDPAADADAADINAGDPAADAEAEVAIFSFGFASGARPPSLAIQSRASQTALNSVLARTFDCRKLVNPSKQSRTGRTGLDKRLRDEVLHAPGTEAFITRCVEDILEETASDTVRPRSDDEHRTLLQYNFGCHEGKHRSVSVAIAVAKRLQMHLDGKPYQVRIVLRHCNVGNVDS